MRESIYLEQRITRFWKLNKIPVPVGLHSYKAKIKLVAGKLVKFAKEKNLSPALVLNEYAYFFAQISRETSFNKIYTRVNEFMDHYTMPTADINDEDVEFAGAVEEDWNALHDATSKDFPFSFITVMLKSGIKLKENTFFKHDHDFRNFCLIANFVRHNRKFYPQIHGMKEFFVHLPIIWRRPKEYITWQYVSPDKTLDKYYQKLYGAGPKEERFKKFATLLKNNESLKKFESVWGVKEMMVTKGE